MADNNTGSGNWAAQTKRNTARLGFWTGLWLLTLALAVFGPLLVWDSRMLTLAGMILNLGVGVGMIVANKTHLQGLDEMQQRIQLEAMALALGVALVAGLAYSTADITDLINFNAEISHLVFLIGITYGIGVFAGRRKYR